jgi:hypothetical protein
MNHEAQEQAALVNHLRWVWGLREDSPVIAAIPNGGYRNPREASNLKRQGVVRGIPDLVLIFSEGRTCWIEMKVKGNSPTPDQHLMHQRLARLGHECLVAYGCDDAIRQLKERGYLKP